MDARPFVADMCAGGNGNMALALTLVKTLAVVLCVSKLCTHTRNSVVVSKGIIKMLTFLPMDLSGRSGSCFSHPSLFLCLYFKMKVFYLF